MSQECNHAEGPVCPECDPDRAKALSRRQTTLAKAAPRRGRRAPICAPKSSAKPVKPLITRRTVTRKKSHKGGNAVSDCICLGCPACKSIGRSGREEEPFHCGCWQRGYARGGSDFYKRHPEVQKPEPEGGIRNSGRITPWYGREGET